jgi:hypothetical protein
MVLHAKMVRFFVRRSLFVVLCFLFLDFLGFGNWDLGLGIFCSLFFVFCSLFSWDLGFGAWELGIGEWVGLAGFGYFE